MAKDQSYPCFLMKGFGKPTFMQAKMKIIIIIAYNTCKPFLFIQATKEKLIPCSIDVHNGSKESVSKPKVIKKKTCVLYYYTVPVHHAYVSYVDI